MDVNSQNFAYFLPGILDDLASCCFVALDLEFSGINPNSPLPHRTHGTQSLQARYTEVKGAAEKYQVVQIGLTICHEDVETGTYVLKPFNIYLSPTIDPKLEVERNITFQSSAADFLVGHNFSMDVLFKSGIRYLSREEEKYVMAKAIERQNCGGVHRSLDVKDSDYQTLNFLTFVRTTVDHWLALGDSRESFLNFPPPSRMTNRAHLIPLNRFQRRLVHQLIEVEYPSLVTIGKPAFIQIMQYNEQREKAVKEQKMRYVQDRMWRQMGLRWIAEALAGGDLSNLDQSYFVTVMSQSTSFPTGQQSLAQFSQALKQRLKYRKPVIVGHNLFMDLVYFYKCFFGPLPDRVEEFQAMAHELFPVLMDTKYMATYDCGSINPTSSLTDINQDLYQVVLPRIAVHPHHTKYSLRGAEHEAGYDSMMTARVFIKLSNQLRRGGFSVYVGPSPYSPQPDINYGFMSDSDDAEDTPDADSLSTIFDLLRLGKTNDTFITSIPAGIPAKTIGMAHNGELIPRLGAKFWKVFGNKLRVFGTQERMCTMG